MQKIINEISGATGLGPEVIEKAVGIMLGLIKSQGHKVKVDELFAKLPGADDLVAAHGGGLMSQMAGGMMGGPLVAIAKIQAAGANMDQAKTIGTLLLGHAKKIAGDDLMRAAAGNIPGVSGYL